MSVTLITMFIPHAKPLIQGTFLARYDRFIARIALGDREVDAHCVNTGRMEGLIVPGSRAWVSQVPDDSPRKLRYTLELLEINGVMIGTNTQLPNRLAETVVQAKQVNGLKRYRKLSREVAYGARSRIDLLLEGANSRHWVEVKNCHLVYPDGGAYFPDSVSKRATGHLEELIQKVEVGDKATVLFVIQRLDGVVVRPSSVHDPAFAEAARQAYARGVRFTGLHFDVSTRGFTYLGTLPVDFRPYNEESVRGYRDALASTSGWQRRGKPR
ncbi:DNA/RNA nuclease SfsA [Congregibacter litoralis]|uniref:Sugar fermentation stimulation protein homolog n=1 Tax=Congregibacter litoralis KT71 TaxID=314285 RepID=A4ACS7_9GAMM|nr:DNA/RNA nuclease SfsA [Congregibacter litoralis]EAQ96291.1 sugar fermentation stimulation protein [Congregibacter litoralis KT71]